MHLGCVIHKAYATSFARRAEPGSPTKGAGSRVHFLKRSLVLGTNLAKQIVGHLRARFIALLAEPRRLERNGNMPCCLMSNTPGAVIRCLT